MVKKIALTLFLIVLIIVGYMYISTRGDKSVQGNEGFNEVSVGVTLKPFKLKDQFDKLHSLKKDTKKIIFVFKKDTGHLVRNYLNKQKDDYLENRDILFIADISKMPAMIREYVAMPDLKQRDYPVMIVYNQELSNKFKKGKEHEKVMIVELDNYNVKDIKYITSEDELKSHIH
jgi:hypothetical protein